MRYLSLDSDTPTYLGKGTFGLVVRGRFHDQPVAIKKVKCKHLEDIIQELSSLVHFKNVPYCVQLLDAFMTKRDSLYRIYMVFELATTTLEQAITTATIHESLQYSRQLVRAIAYIHQCGIVHRDLKPANLFIRNEELIVGDFGHSTHLNDSLPSVSSSEHQQQHPHKKPKQANHEPVSLSNGNYICTLWYRAPELLLSGHHTKAIDMWSVGCLVVEFILKKPLFPAKDEKDLLVRMVDMIGKPTIDDTQAYTKSHMDQLRWTVVSTATSLLILMKIKKQLVHKVQEILSDDEITSLLDSVSSMLQWCMDERITAQQAALLTFFSGINNDNKDDTKPEPKQYRPMKPGIEDACRKIQPDESLLNLFLEKKI